MNKAILISIRPQHALNILNGIKTLELRKRVPKGYVGWVYVYVTKGKRLSVVHDDENGKTYFYLNSNWGRELNQDIPCRFWFDEFTFLKYGRWVNHRVGDWNYRGFMDEHLETFNKACITEKEVIDYGKGKDLYAWHIKNLEILDEPMVLNDFCTWNKGDKWTPDMNWLTLKRAPQSWQYVYVKERLDDTI